jgi:hypothetical protein
VEALSSKSILLSQNCTSRRKGGEGLINHLGVVDGVTTKSKLRYNAVKLGVECDENWKIHHAEADPIAPGLWNNKNNPKKILKKKKKKKNNNNNNNKKLQRNFGRNVRTPASDGRANDADNVLRHKQYEHQRMS